MNRAYNLDIPLAPRNKVRSVSTFMPTFISKHLYKGGALTEELEFPQAGKVK